jgi:hypothetical protein
MMGKAKNGGRKKFSAKPRRPGIRRGLLKLIGIYNTKLFRFYQKTNLKKNIKKNIVSNHLDIN